jgi:hypothetical protein
MAPRRTSNRAKRLDEEEDDEETSEYPMDMDSESGDLTELPEEEFPEEEEEEEDVEEEDPVDEQEEIPDEEPTTANDASPQRKKLKPSSTGVKKVKLTPYQKRFGQVSELGGLELEDIDEEIDEKGETKITKDGVLLGGAFMGSSIVQSTHSK